MPAHRNERAVVDDLGCRDGGSPSVTDRRWRRRTYWTRSATTFGPKQTEGKIAIEDASYFLSKLELVRGRKRTMPQWRKRLFIATSYITADAAERFGLPRERTVIMGSRIEV